MLAKKVKEPAAALASRIRRVVNGDSTTAVFEPTKHVIQRRGRRLAPLRLSLLIVLVKEGVWNVCAMKLAPVCADVKDLCCDAEPHQVASDCGTTKLGMRET